MINSAVILSAGLGTRMAHIAKDVPKVMLPIQGKPLLVRHIEWMKSYGIMNFYINLHHLPVAITSALKDGYDLGVSIKYSHEENLLGTSGAILPFQKFLTDSFILHYGDVLSKVNLGRMIECHEKTRASATLAVHKTNRPHDSDIVEVQDDGRIKRLHVRPGNFEFGDLGNAALYILSPRVFEFLPSYNPSDFVKDVFPKMINAGERMFAYPTEEFTRDVGTPERYASAAVEWKE